MTFQDEYESWKLRYAHTINASERSYDAPRIQRATIFSQQIDQLEKRNYTKRFCCPAIYCSRNCLLSTCLTLQQCSTWWSLAPAYWIDCSVGHRQRMSLNSQRACSASTANRQGACYCPNTLQDRMAGWKLHALYMHSRCRRTDYYNFNVVNCVVGNLCIIKRNDSTS